MAKKLWKVAAGVLLALGSALGQEETVTFSYTGNPVLIVADEADVISVAPITVPRALRITKVTARVQVDFDGVGDLNVYLYSPIETRARILERNCGTLRNIDTTFDDAAPSTFASFCPTEAGRGPYRPNEPLSNYNGQASIGIWRLAVENNGSNKLGWLTSFSITITGTRITTPTINSTLIGNSASLKYPSSAAPGELVSIFGIALGPTTPAVAPGGANWPTTLGGTTVTVDGTPVPIGFASAYRVDIQIPYTLGPTQTTVVVSNGGQSSGPANLAVAPTRPGIYTLDQSGTGPAKVVNQAGTLNSRANPAPKGSIVTVYASGLGATTPTVTAGQLTPASPLAMTSQAVAASIGGVPAGVTYAGLAPGLTGIYQVNVRVEQSVQSGTRELVLSVGGSASQSEATIEVQ